MKHSKWLKFIEWFFRVWGWLAITVFLMLLLILIAIIMSPATDPRFNNITTICLILTFWISGMALYYITLQFVWKIFREIRNNFKITSMLLKILNRIKYILLILYFHQLLFLIAAYITNNFETAFNEPGKFNLKIRLTLDFLIPSFGNGMGTLFLFFIALFIQKFLISYRELKDSKERLEEEQRYTV